MEEGGGWFREERHGDGTGRVSIGDAFAPIGATLNLGHLEPLLRTGIRGFCAVRSVVDVVVCWCVVPIEVEGLHLFY